MEKSYDKLIDEIKNDLNEMNSTNISMDEAMKLFEDGIKKITQAKEKLNEYKGKINKVLEDNSIEEFEN